MNRCFQNANAKNHAMLFSFIAKSALELIGEDGVDSLKKGVKKYGNQRGNRMAQRVFLDGRDLTYLNYLVYGEWEAELGEVESILTNENNNTNLILNKCPWFDAWSEAGMTDIGKIYCDIIDEALVEGFNPKLQFQLNNHRTGGKETCDFCFINSGLDEDDLTMINNLKNQVGNSTKEGWDYHIGHLYKALKDQLINDFHKQGEAVIDNALNMYKNKFGIETFNKVLEFKNIDFNHIREYVSVF